MSLGIIIPAVRKELSESKIKKILMSFKSKINIDTNKIEIIEDLNLIICNIHLPNGNAITDDRFKRKVRRRLDKIFLEEGVWSVLEHPSIRNLYGHSGEDYDTIILDIAINRFTEIFRCIRNLGNLAELEITITGNSMNLEYAISRLITSVKSMNILLPEGSEEPEEAEQAFEETGIPVHITEDPEVLDRTSLWIRFPDDHVSFDALPSGYKGLIMDLGALKVIDTRAKTIYNIGLEFPEKIRKKIGSFILNEFERDLLAGFVLAYCTNTWGKSAAEVSIRLGMRLSLKP